MIEIKPAQAWMVKALYGAALERTVVAIVAQQGETVLGIAGFYPEDGKLVLFVRITDKARGDLMRYRRPIIAAAREILKRASRWHLPVVTWCDTRFEKAPAMLEHFGFRETKAGIYEWSAHG